MNIRPRGDGTWLIRDGTGLILAERIRQITEEGYTSEHDDEHHAGEFSLAARGYALTAWFQIAPYVGWTEEILEYEVFNGICNWPWESPAYKPSDDPVRNLAKAGALIAAEIDRLLRQEERGYHE